MEDIESLKLRKQMAFTNWNYAGQRIDLLIITISGAGIYLILEILKLSIDKPLLHLWSIKAAGISYVVSIIVNLISQFTGQESNESDQRWCKAQIYASNPRTPAEDDNIEKLDKHSNKYSVATAYLNYFSLLTMSIGLILTIGFCLFSF